MHIVNRVPANVNRPQSAGRGPQPLRAHPPGLPGTLAGESPQPMLSLSPPPYEVRCPLHGSIPFDERERAIIDHPFFQRLRSVSQLGLAALVYPGATHTRFSHALGVMHLAGRIFQAIASRSGGLREAGFTEEELGYFLRVVRFAGLLHDLGHPPFSHSFEPLLPPRRTLPLPWDWYAREDRTGQATHEDFSIAAVHALTLERPPLLDAEEARDVCALIDGGIAPTVRLTGDDPRRNVYPLLKQVISGEIDADRMDYLRRDAHFAGVTYGVFDLPRLVQGLSCTLTPEGWAMTLDPATIYTYENFLMARFHMAMQVYFHKTLLPFEYYLQRAVEEGEVAVSLDGSLDSLLAAREDRVLAALYEARHRRWSARIVQRKPARRLVQFDESFPPEVRRRLVEALEATGMEVIHIREHRRLSNLGVKGQPHGPPIYVQETVLGRERRRPLQAVSGLLTRYNQLFTIESLYCQPQDHERGMAVLQAALGEAASDANPLASGEAALRGTGA